MTPEALLGGFSAAPLQSARAFRAALEAMARPGTIWMVEGALPPAPMSVAAGVLVLTLCDGTTPLHLGASLDLPVIRDWVTFHTGAPLVGAAEAQFALGTWADLTPVSRFAVGLPDYPDRSATLIVELAALTAEGPRLTGPGIAEALARTGEILTEDIDYLDGLALAEFERIAKIGATSIEMPVADLEGLPKVIRVRIYLRALEVFAVNNSRTHLTAIDQLIENWHGQKELTLPGVRVIRKADELSFKTTKTLNPGAC